MRQSGIFLKLCICQGALVKKEKVHIVTAMLRAVSDTIYTKLGMRAALFLDM